MRARWFPLVSLETQRTLRRLGKDIGRLILEEAPPPTRSPRRSGAGHMGPRIAGAMREFADARREAERERDAALARVGELERDLADVRDELWELQQENESIQGQLGTVAASANGTAPADEDTGQPSVQSVAEAVERASRLRRLRFLPDAFKSAEESSFERPAEVYTAFAHLSLLAGLRLTGSIGMSIENWLAERGVSYAPHLGQERDMARYRSQYLFRVDGERVLFEEHLKFGIGKNPNHCFRIYMKWDQEKAEWIIGHVGRHLENAKA